MHTRMSLRITAAIPTYRRPAQFRRALESVLLQTRPADAVIVGDDGSSDEVRQIVCSYSNPKITYVARHCTGRMTDNWNFVTRWPNDGFVALLEDDNIWHEDHLKWAELVLRRYPDAAIYHAGHQEAWDRDGRLDIYKCHFPPWHHRLAPEDGGLVDVRSVVLDSLAVGSINSSTTVAARAAYERSSGFDHRFPMGMDTLMWTRLAMDGGCVYGPYLATTYTYHCQNVSRTEISMRRAGRQSRGSRRLLLREALRLGCISLSDLGEFLAACDEGTWAAFLTMLAHEANGKAVRNLAYREWSLHPERRSGAGFLRATRYLGFPLLSHVDQIDYLWERWIRLSQRSQAMSA